MVFTWRALEAAYYHQNPASWLLVPPLCGSDWDFQLVGSVHEQRPDRETDDVKNDIPEFSVSDLFCVSLDLFQLFLFLTMMIFTL